jgi:hypothetical protein
MIQEIYWDEETRLYSLYNKDEETGKLVLVSTAPTVEELYT